MEDALMELNIGDVVRIDGVPGLYVFFGSITPQDPGRMCYMDDFKFLKLDDAINIETLDRDDSRFMYVHIEGIQMTPNVAKVEGEAPFEITPRRVYDLRRKKKKKIEIYE